MNKTTENLLAAIESYVPPEVVPIVFRLYYNIHSGKVVDVSTDLLYNNDPDVDSIVISRQEADTYPQYNPNITIVDGKIVKKHRNFETTQQAYCLKVKSSVSGNIATDDYNMLIINNHGKNQWQYK